MRGELLGREYGVELELAWSVDGTGNLAEGCRRGGWVCTAVIDGTFGIPNCARFVTLYDASFQRTLRLPPIENRIDCFVRQSQRQSGNPTFS